MALAYLRYTFQAVRKLTARLTQTSGNFNPPSRSDDVSSPQIGVTNEGALANTAAGGGDEAYSSLITLAASGTTTINLSSFVNAMGVSGAALARMKTIEFWHVSQAQDATYGKTSTQVTIGNHGTTPSPLFLGAGTHTIVLKAGEYVGWGTPQAAGIVVSTAINILITNNDAVNQASIMVTITGGST